MQAFAFGDRPTMWDIITHNMGKYEDSPNALSTEMEQVDVEHRNSFFAIDVANTDICMHV